VAEIRGRLRADGRRFGLVVARFNEFVTERLLDGARAAFQQLGVDDDSLDIVWVPGSFELPLVAQTMAGSGNYAAVICLGTVIRGETAHFEHVAGQTAAGIAAAARQTGVPILFGVLTTDTLDQAINRAGAKSGNKGYEAAMNAVEVADLLDQLKAGS
jgi:6,7-dimethyl-8-ribityllumazine synthase